LSLKVICGDIAVGFTGDARWPLNKEIKGFYGQCRALFAHVGSFVKQGEIDALEKNAMGQQRSLIDAIGDYNHLYYIGTVLLIKRSARKARLAVLSEFGEELKGNLRQMIVDRLKRDLGNKKHIAIIAGDVGTRVSILTQSHESRAAGTVEVRCAVCETYVAPSEVRMVAYGPEEGLFNVCNGCRCRFEPHQITSKLERLYTYGRSGRAPLGKNRAKTPESS
jgi:hypothetical protein